MALQERDAFREITIKATDKGLVGVLSVSSEIYDDDTSEIKTSQKHRQVVPLDDPSKTYNTPLGSKTVGELVSGINVDIAATNADLINEVATEKSAKETALAEVATEKSKNALLQTELANEKSKKPA